jgi:hypothetical protein
MHREFSPAGHCGLIARPSSNGAENEIVAERRIVKAEACERADRCLLANISEHVDLFGQRFLLEQVLALKFRVRPLQSMV